MIAPEGPARTPQGIDVQADPAAAAGRPVEQILQRRHRRTDEFLAVPTNGVQGADFLERQLVDSARAE